MLGKVIPLKNKGFQKNNGAKPHFKKIENTITNQDKPIEKMPL